MKVHLKSNEKSSEIDFQELYVLTNHWLKDMDFFKDELRFFEKIMKNYISTHGTVSKYQVDLLKNQLDVISMETHALTIRLLNHQEKLDLQVKNIITEAKKDIVEEHADLELKIAELMKSFRKFKEDLFEETKHIIDLEAED